MQNKVEKQREHFEAIAENYFCATQHPNCIAFFNRIWAGFLALHPYILPEDAKMLECMCGHGIAKDYLENTLHKNFRYSGFDYSQPLVDIARRRMPGANVFLQDVTTFQSNAEYALIFLSGGLHHVFEQTKEVLERLYDALIPGGYMLSAEPTYNNFLGGMIGEAIYKSSSKFEHESEKRYALKELNAYYLNSGFTIVDQFYPGLLAYSIAVSAFCFPRICVGSPALMERLIRIERPLYRKWLGKKLSFCTITLLRKPLN